MSGDAAPAFFDSLLRFIEGDSEVKAAFDGELTIRDRHHRLDTLPALYWGNCCSSRWRGAAFEGNKHEFDLLVFSFNDGLAGSRALAGVLIGLLHDCDFVLPGHALVDFQFKSAKTVWDQHEGCYVGKLRFCALTVSD
jgi:Protein of unknown function (DUF3168)